MAYIMNKLFVFCRDTCYNYINFFIVYIMTTKLFVYCFAFCVLGIDDLFPTIVLKHMCRKNPYLYIMFFV
jgi:hypothetical protein